MWPLCNSQQTVMWPLCNSQVTVMWYTPHHFNDLQQLVQKRAVLVKSLEYRTFTTHVTLSNRWVVSSLILHKAELTFPRMVTKWLHMVRIKQWSRPFSVNIFTIVTTTPWGNREARVLLWNTPCVGPPSTLSSHKGAGHKQTHQVIFAVVWCTGPTHERRSLVAQVLGLVEVRGFVHCNCRYKISKLARPWWV